MTTEYYSFAAIRGKQGNYENYVIHCPLRLVPRLFVFDGPELPDELRFGRTVKVNTTRVSELVYYLSMHPNDYVLPPLVATIDCAVTFEPFSRSIPDIGQMKIPLTARLVLHDGQHRQVAIQQVIEEEFWQMTTSNDTIPVMLFIDPQLKRSHRIFADLNQTRVRPSKSQRILNDHDSPLADLVRQLVDETPLFYKLTELEKTTISNRSTALFTLNAVYQATQALLGVTRRGRISADQTTFAMKFWREAGEAIPEWEKVIECEMLSYDLRQNYVHGHGVTLLAIGMVGNTLIQMYPLTWVDYVRALGRIDWSRENTKLWEGRAMVRGKMSKAQDSIKLTANAIKQELGIALTADELELEQTLLS